MMNPVSAYDFKPEARMIHIRLSSVVSKLIEKEEEYILDLQLLARHLQIVSTDACNKLPLFNDILEFHTKILREFFADAGPLNVAAVFIKHRKKLKLYVKFAKIKSDFSYLVMDVCEEICDRLKARLLEYNFTLSQLRDLCGDDYEVIASCEEAEKFIKKIYLRLTYRAVKMEAATKS